MDYKDHLQFFFQRNHLGRSFWRCVVPSLCYCHKLIREVQLLLSQALVPPTVVGLMCSHRCSAYSVSFSPPVSHHIHWPCCGHLWLIRHSLFPHVRGWVTARWPPTVGDFLELALQSAGLQGYVLGKTLEPDGVEFVTFRLVCLSVILPTPEFIYSLGI